MFVRSIFFLLPIVFRSWISLLESRQQLLDKNSDFKRYFELSLIYESNKAYEFVEINIFVEHTWIRILMSIVTS